MASTSSTSWVYFLTAVVHVVALASSSSSSTQCCKTIYSFGDSLADTGNGDYETQRQNSLNPPYGETYFHHPTGRWSDGRLVIDFFAQHMGIPLLKPYLGIKNSKIQDWNPREGVNFAVAGATALDPSFFAEKGVYNLPTNYSLRVQLDWFKELLPSICNSSSGCNKVLGNSLFLAGEIGGNDLNFPLLQGRSIAEVKTYVPYVINAIASAISELIDLGARTLMVPGNMPMGCVAVYLTQYETKDKNQYDPAGCLKWLNEFAEHYNQKLQIEIDRLRGLHPHANIIYADYYNAALQLYQYPTKFGFTGLKICCGKGGPYNYNASATCGEPGVIACYNPSQYIGWDGVHWTEAAYRLIAEGLLNGPYSIPKFSSLSFMNVSFEYFKDQHVSFL